MRFGWLTLGLSPFADGDYAAIHEQVAQACFAEPAGFDGIWLTESSWRSSTPSPKAASTSVSATGPTPHAKVMESTRRFGAEVILKFS